MSHSSSLTDAQKELIRKVMLDPCAHLSLSNAGEPLDVPGPTASFAQEKAFAARKKEEHLRRLCEAGTFSATASRISEPRQVGAGNAQRQELDGELVFEARIKSSNR